MLHKLIHKPTRQVFRKLPSYLELRSNTYYFRYRLPIKVAALINKTEIRFSLRTDSLSEAYSRLHQFIPIVNSIKRFSFQKTLKRNDKPALNRLVKQLSESRFDVMQRETSAYSTPFSEPKATLEAINPMMLFSEIHDQLIDYKIKNKGLTDKMRDSYLRYKNLFLLISGDKAVNLITTRDLKNYLAKVAELPRKNIKPYCSMTWEEITQLEIIPDNDKVAAKTPKEHLKWLQGVFAYLIYQLDYKLENPTKAIRMRIKPNRYGSFDDHEVNSILRNAAGADWQYWLPRLAFFTGARRGELVNLQKKNIKYHPDAQRYYLQITNEGNKKLKTDNALRLVPLSEKLVDQGFIKFVDSVADDECFIFGDVSFVTKHITDWFNHNLLKKSEVKVYDETGHKRVFHSTRHTFVTKAIQANILPQLVQELVGHDKSSGLGITARYTHRFSLKELCKVVDVIDY
ncbi:DUF6538 domain-containing protein [Thalassomonas sp. M1454]|uniref:DUF6538 domain-containing protein n=1 Tax=Thalassomonas sp. M1454 TaxID=2594477 RepID=UPI00117E698F|nr:DUF6538 domain-containing protein [Thalassomonas sp. M1454]TRX52755.1 DUF3258 domain-containing protein [Thalassomonas sp. M1454]